MVKDLMAAAESVGITAFITNSTEKIETQLNRLTDVDQLPIMLVSWDIVTDLTFDEHGFLNNPSSQITLLLMDKAEDKAKSNMEETADKMGELFQDYVRALYNQLIQYQKFQGTDILTGIQYTRVPRHGAGQHSGVLGRFRMTGGVTNC